MQDSNEAARRSEQYLLALALSYAGETSEEAYTKTDGYKSIKEVFDIFFAERKITGEYRAVFILEHLVAISERKEVWEALINSYLYVRKDVIGAIKAFAKSRELFLK